MRSGAVRSGLRCAAWYGASCRMRCGMARYGAARSGPCGAERVAHCALSVAQTDALRLDVPTCRPCRAAPATRYTALPRTAAVAGDTRRHRVWPSSSLCPPQCRPGPRTPRTVHAHSACRRPQSVCSAAHGAETMSSVSGSAAAAAAAAASLSCSSNPSPLSATHCAPLPLSVAPCSPHTDASRCDACVFGARSALCAPLPAHILLALRPARPPRTAPRLASGRLALCAVHSDGGNVGGWMGVGCTVSRCGDTSSWSAAAAAAAETLRTGQDRTDDVRRERAPSMCTGMLCGGADRDASPTLAHDTPRHDAPSRHRGSASARNAADVPSSLRAHAAAEIRVAAHIPRRTPHAACRMPCVRAARGSCLCLVWCGVSAWFAHRGHGWRRAPAATNGRLSAMAAAAAVRVASLSTRRVHGSCCVWLVCCTLYLNSTRFLSNPSITAPDSNTVIVESCSRKVQGDRRKRRNAGCSVTRTPRSL